MISISKSRKWYRSVFSLALLLFCSQGFSQKMLLQPAESFHKPKIHPYTKSLINPQPQPQAMSSKGDYDKLLVILVDFQIELEDDPNTTGNGKFMLQPDPDYLYSIAAPPHDQEYFEANLDAMRYYYLAVSAGSYNLQYDVWPKDKAAYTLPHSMAYYNPPQANNQEFVALMEEYFKAAFETADQDDPEIDFSAYAHYMIIHAGSDWQHDIFGDTPSDLPSFFIRVGDGKQVSVDDGQTEIYHACNVPATISQDFEVESQDGYNIHSGYGALNSVLFHEFGHSLGLVDLYNVRSFYPMVGAFDIMDSGGSGILVDELANGDLVYVEGVLPALPGAFSRALLFEENFRNRGLMVDASELPPYSNVDLAASSMKQMEPLKPNLIRFSLSDDEYFLIENRSVDPDSDGNTAVYGTLEGRVILYPTAQQDDNNIPTYEYDYLLPSFIGADDSAQGGGILVWHVDDHVIYQEGSILEDGSFWSNFENNSINTNFDVPGVSVLEADGLRDLGEAYSMYWTGTPYEYFHALKPVLDSDGRFVNWSLDAWRPTLSSHTKPAMLARNGLGSLYYLDDISSPAAVMNFKLKSGFFTDLYSEQLSGNQYVAPPINTNYSELSVPIYGAASINLYSYESNGWQNFFGPSAMPTTSFDHPLISLDNNGDGYLELAGVLGNKLYFMDFANINIQHKQITFSDSISTPLTQAGELYTHTGQEIYRIRDYAVEEFASIAGIKTLAIWEDRLLALRESDCLLLDPASLDLINTIELPERFGLYEPLVVDMGNAFELYLMADSGNLYRYHQSGVSKIFTNQSDFLPTQIGGLVADDSGVQVFFGLGDRAYLLGYNGYIKAGFPRYLDQVLTDPYEHPKALLIDDAYILLFPVMSQGYLALTQRGEPRPQYSLLYHAGIVPYNDYLYYDANNAQLLWYNAQKNDSGSRLFIHSMITSENPIIWNGYRNQAGGAVLIPEDLGESTPSPGNISAYVFPNPVKKGIFRLRIRGALAPTQVSIFDISGNQVFSQTVESDIRIKDVEIDASKYSSGVYIVQIKNAHSHKTIKFAIEK